MTSPKAQTVKPIVICFAAIDDADVVEYFIQYHLSIGVDAFVATDLGSRDGTLDVLEAYETKGVLHLTRHSSPEAGDADDGLDSVATAIRVYGAEWCIFADPDEFWIVPHDDVA